MKTTSKPDTRQWQEYTATHPQGNIYQTPQLHEVYQQTKNYEPIVIATLDDSDNITALLQAVVIKERSDILSGLTTRSIIQGGPLYTNTKALDALLEKYDEIIRKKAIYTQIRNQWETGEIRNKLEATGYKYTDHLNYLINLNRKTEEIWRDIHKSRRKGINRAEKNGISIKKIENTTELNDCYQLIKETYQKVKMPIADQTLFKNTYNQLTTNNTANFYIAHQNNKPVGTRITLTYKKTVHDWYAGSKKDTAYVDEALVWHILQENAGKQQTFDFGGAGHPQKPYGVREFKKRFGGKEVNHGRYQKTHNTLKQKIAETGYKIYKKTG